MVLRRILLNAFIALFSFILSGVNAAIPDSLLREAIRKGVVYLSASQVGSEKDSLGLIGEWPSYIRNEAKIPYLGKKGKTAYDSNLFNTLFVYNILAEICLDTKNDNILPVLELALKNFSYYQNGNSFNFWPLLERPKKFKCKHPDCKQRRPAHFRHRYKLINSYANIYDDADDTAAGVLAYHYASLLKIKTGSPTDRNYVVHFTQHRDTGRRKTNWYNKRLGFKYRTGAYLTWFGPDRKHSGFVSWFFPRHHQNILYGRNEIDCVVNANVLRTLYVLGDTNIAGVSEAKAFIRKSVEKKKCLTCGVYYPTEFSFHYAVAKAVSSGVSGLNGVKAVLVEQVKAALAPDRVSNVTIARNELQATLYAVNALMLLEPTKETAVAVQPAIDFVYLNMLTEQEKAHWFGGVFFSGGSAVRYLHVWRSDAYTTALAMEAFNNYLRIKV